MSEVEEGAKAVQEVAKTTGKAIDVARRAGSFLSRFIQRPLEQGSGIVEDYLIYVRWERQLRLMDRANALMKERGLTAPTRPVPIKIALPIMRDGSLEETNELQDIWAQLLVNAADADSGVEVRHAFLTILKDLTPLDAIILTKIYSFSDEEAGGSGVWTGELPEAVYVRTTSGPKNPMREDVRLSISNLLRLGLLATATVWGGGQSVHTVYHTALGREFVKACTSGKNGSKTRP